ncbi:MAG: ABC transporter permease [Lachnospiraceae bacterium]|nr:ABC transporter permease [Lachnospiraceae bacterium]
MITIIKSTMKLLLRSKGFWFFLVVVPMLSTIIFKAQRVNVMNMDPVREGVIDIESEDEKVAYHGGAGEYLIKVYDASKTETSEYFLNKLGNCGLMSVYRMDITSESDTDAYVKEAIESDGFNDRMGLALYIKPDFDVTVYLLSEDERNDIVLDEIRYQISRIDRAGNNIETLKAVDEMLPEKEIVETVTGGERNMTPEQKDKETSMGYAFSIMTLAYVFCGIFVAHGAINEQKNGVYTRIRLTGTDTLKYFASKFAAVFCVNVMVTAVLSGYSFFLKESDLGITRLQYTLVIFLMGLVFSTISMVLGIIMGDIMSANVAAFTVWCMSSLLGGLYFPVEYTTGAVRTLSYVIPHKWFVEGVEMILTGDNQVYFMLICITVAYLIVTISLGSLGLKVKRTGEWGTT